MVDIDRSAIARETRDCPMQLAAQHLAEIVETVKKLEAASNGSDSSASTACPMR